MESQVFKCVWATDITKTHKQRSLSSRLNSEGLTGQMAVDLNSGMRMGKKWQENQHKQK